jgi:signal transduction histidine kinase
MDRQLRHLARLVEDLLDANRVIHGKIALRKERIDLARVVTNAVADISAQLRDADVRAEIHVPRDPIWVDGDEVRLAQAIGNVLDNARSFTESGGSVEISLQLQEHGQATLTVRDTGIGIAPDALPFVHEPLFQADASLERARGGLGLGLTVAKTLIELHGGTISISSDGIGRGTTVVIRLRTSAGGDSAGD